MATTFSFNPLQMAIRPLYEKAKAEDELFAQRVQEAESRTEKPKSLAECCDYIMGEAYKYASEHKDGNFGLAGCSDEQMVGMIKHYYFEDDIVINKVGKASVKMAVTKPAEKAKDKGKGADKKDTKTHGKGNGKPTDGKKKGKAKEDTTSEAELFPTSLFDL